MADPVYALSIKHPWAALIVHGHKTVEVRAWPTQRRGLIYLHAARVPSREPIAWGHMTESILPTASLNGGIIGAAELVDCITYRTAEAFARDRSRHLNDPSWFQPRGLYGFVLSNVRTVPFHRCPGNVRFFRVWLG